MKKTLLLILFACISVFAYSGLLPSAGASSGLSRNFTNANAFGIGDSLDSFTDGDFISNPAWSGNAASFSVVADSTAAAGATGSQTLRLNAPATSGTEYLSTQIAEWGTSQEWRFWIGRRAQAFTAANQQYVWLYANEATLTSSTVDGYRIAIGDDSGSDEIRLEYIVNGVLSTTVITSAGSVPNGLTDIGFQVLVKRAESGSWGIYTSSLPTASGSGSIAADIPTSATASIFQGSGIHNSRVPGAGGYFGVAALHSTGANAVVAAEWDQFYFTPRTDSPLPFITNQIVSAAIGQPNLTTVSSGVTDLKMNAPWDVAIDAATSKVYVADNSNHRVLRFADSQTLTSGGVAEAVFGQASFTTRTTGNSLSQMNGPRGLAIAPNGSLWVADSGNNRIIFFTNAATATSGTAATGSLTTTGPGFSQLGGLSVDSGGRLWVADTGNDRVVRFDTPNAGGNTVPSARACGNGGISASTCSQPLDAHVDENDRLWIADSGYYRVLRFDNASTLTTGSVARGVLGQISFTTAESSTAQNRVGTSRSVMTDPNGNLYVSDETGIRIMVFSNAAQLPNGANALAVLGQSNFTNGDTPATDRGASPPTGLAFDTVRWDLLVSDPTRHRVIRYDGTDPDPDLPPTNVSTDTPTNITGNSVTLRGSASPNASGTVGYFRYGTTDPGLCTDAYGTRAPTNGGVSLGSGTAQESFSLNVTGLTPGTIYYYCAAAENAGGRAFGAAVSFTTAALPDSVTDAATDIRTTTAALRGFATPNGSDTTAYFRIEQGTGSGPCDDSFGTRTPSSGGVLVPSSSTQTAYAHNVEGLQPFTTYSFCSVAENGAGRSFGAISTFTTRDTRTFIVDTESDDAAAVLNDCSGSVAGDCSLRGAVSVAGDGDTIEFEQAATFNKELAPTAAISLASELAINYDILINGLGVSNLTINGGGTGSNRIIAIAHGSDATIRNLRLSAGGGNGANLSSFGGAILVEGRVNLDTVEIVGGSADDSGGAVFIADNGVAEIRNSTIYSNTSAKGGGIAADAGTVLIESSTVSGNTDQYGGGGAFFDGANVTIRNSTVTANTSTGVNGAGGITSFGAAVQIASSIVSGNASPSADDIANLAGGSVTSQGFNMIGDEAGDSTATGNAIAYQSTDILDQPHRLGVLQNNGGQTATHLPEYSFPGLDKGCAFGLLTDQRGYSRTENFTGVADNTCSDPNGNGTDIGAVELPLIPTAAPVSIAGNVVTIKRLGIRGAIITIYGGDLNEPLTAVTNSFGRYRVEGLTAGHTYIVSVRAGKYSFPVPTRAFTLDDNVSDADFTANR